MSSILIYMGYLVKVSSILSSILITLYYLPPYTKKLSYTPAIFGGLFVLLLGIFGAILYGWIEAILLIITAVVIVVLIHFTYVYPKAKKKE